MRFSAIFRNAQTILLLIAILFGVWYFIKKEFYPPEVVTNPRAVIAHEIFSACLDSEHRWIRVIVEVRNVGLDPVELSDSRHYFAQLVPADDELSSALSERRALGGNPVAIEWGRFAEPREIFNQGVEASAVPAPSVVVEINESHRQYLDFVILPSVEVFEITSTFRDASGGEARHPASDWTGEAQTVYQIKADPTCSE